MLWFESKTMTVFETNPHVELYVISICYDNQIFCIYRVLSLIKTRKLFTFNSKSVVTTTSSFFLF